MQKLLKISFKYWKKHKKRMFFINISIILITIIIVISSNLTRENLMFDIDLFFNLKGNYDAVFCEQDKNVIDSMKDLEETQAFGSNYELGYISALDFTDPKNKMDISIQTYDDSNKDSDDADVVTNKNSNIFKVDAFCDKTSEEIYHMNCLVGHHPTNSNEISLDFETAIKFNIRSDNIGDKIFLYLYDLEKNKIKTKEYIVSGLFEFNKESRFVNQTNLVNYIPPLAFMHISENDIFKSSKKTGYIQSNKYLDPTDYNCGDIIFRKIAALHPDQNIDENYSTIQNRFLIYSKNLVNNDYRNADKVFDSLNDSQYVTQDVINKHIKEKKYIENSFSVYLTRFVYFYTFIMILIMYHLIKNITQDRKQNIGILRSMGVSSPSIILNLCLEILVFFSVSTLIGYFIGKKLYILLLYFKKNVLHVSTFNALNADDFIKLITKDPLWLSIAINAILFVFSSIVIIFIIKKGSILNMVANISKKTNSIKKRKSNKKNNKNNFSLLNKKSFSSIIGNKLNFTSTIIVIITILGIISCSLLPQYLSEIKEKFFFHVNFSSNHDNFYTNEHGHLNVKHESDFTARKNPSVTMYGPDVENRHSIGIDKNDVDYLIDDESFKTFVALIEDKSFKMTVDENEYNNIPECLKSLDYSNRFANTTASDNIVKLEVRKLYAELQALGFNKNQKILETPLIGIHESSFDKIKDKVIAGEIHEDKIKSGEEIIVLVNNSYANAIKNYMTIGKEINLADCIPGEKQENLAFEKISSGDELGELIFTENLESEKYTSYGYKLGTKKDIKSKVGAIISLEKDDISSYMRQESDESPIMNFMCFPKTFESMGLINNKYTYVELSLSDSNNITSFSNKWNDILKKSPDMITISKKESVQIKEKMASLIVDIFFKLLNILLIILLSIGLIIILISKVKLHTRNISILRSMGADDNQLIKILLKQNALLPIIGCIVSLSISIVIHYFYDYIYKNYLKLADKYEFISRLNYSFKILTPKFFKGLAFGLILYTLVIMIATISQICILKKNSIVHGIEVSDF